MATALLTRDGTDLNRINRDLANTDAAAIIDWAARTFGRGLVMTSSFGAQAAVLLHLMSRRVPDIPVILVDTGYMFAETYRFVDQLTRRLKLNLKVYEPLMSAARREALYGRLWEQGESGIEQYHEMSKVEPLRRALDELKATAWLAGLRREQTNYRATLRTVEFRDGLYKIHPILEWSTKDVDSYFEAHDLPPHPLVHRGYVSIGDTHSTRPICDGEDERAGRFGGLKQECGLHVPETYEERQSRDSSGL